MYDLGVKSASDIKASPTRQSVLLSRLAADRDKEVFELLFGYFAPRIKAYALTLSCDDATAEEIAQQTMVKVWRKAHLFDPSKAAASTWIFRIARNTRTDIARKEIHRAPNGHDFSALEDEADTPERLVGRSQDVDIVRGALDALPSDQLHVVRLSFFEGLSHGDIADRLGIPLGTVKSRMRLAFHKLRESVGVSA